jgi:hypothetical protein
MKPGENYTDSDVEAALQQALEQSEFPISNIRTYGEAGLLTMDCGIVITMENGQKFQVRIIEA